MTRPQPQIVFLLFLVLVEEDSDLRIDRESVARELTPLDFEMARVRPN